MASRILGSAGLVLVIVAGQVHADPRFERISVEDGLSQSSVFALAQDSRGFLWVGTEQAADRYDGYEFVAYRYLPGVPDSLSDSTVRAFFNDQDERLWIGTDNGINRFDPASGRIQRFRPEGKVGAQRLQVLEQGIVEHCQGDVLFLARDGLWAVPQGNGVPETITLEGREDSRFSGSILTDNDGGVWLADGRHLWFRPCRADDFRVVDRLPASAARSLAGPNALALGPDGAVLWASGDGLRRFDSRSGRLLLVDRPSLHGMNGDKIDAVAVGSGDDLWLALPGQIVRIRQSARPRWQLMAEFDALAPTNTGLQRLQVARSGDGLTWLAGHFGVGVQAESGEHLQILRNDPTDPESLPMTFGRAGYVLHADKFGVVWIGANLAGLARYVPQKHRFEHVRDLDPGADNIIRGIAEQQVDGQTWVWTGSAQSGLRLWRRGADGSCRLRCRISVDAAGLPATPTDRVTALARNPVDGRVWAAGNDWVVRLDAAGPEVIRVPFAGQGPESTLSAMAFSASGKRLFVSEYRRLWYLDVSDVGRQGELQPVPADRLEDSHGIYALATTRDGRVLAGGRGGLFMIDPDSGTSRRFLPGGDEELSPANFVFSLLESPEGTLWIGTRGGGLARTRLGDLDRDEPQFEWWNRETGLVDDTIYAILPDESGRLWLSSNRGLMRFEPETGQVRHYGAHDGLQQYEFNGRVADVGPSGQYYFGGVDGFNVFRPADIVDHPLPPSIQLQSVRVHNEVLATYASGNSVDGFELDHDDNYLVFDYVGLHFAVADKVRYAYWLEGLESEWVDAGELRQARYPALPPGEYRFHVRAANSDAVWSEPRHLATVTIHPPPWRSPLAWMIYLFIVSLGVALLALLVVRRRRALEALIAHRTRELAERNRIISRQSRQLEEALEARTTLFANVSHEFRTPLTLVEASLDRLSRKVGEDHSAIGQGRHYLRRLQRLVEQLLDLSRMRLGGASAFGEPWHLTPVVNHTVEAFRTLADQRGLNLRSRLENGWTTRCRQEFVERILLNLLNNAIKYSGKGGTVTVTVTGTNNEVWLEVSDNGPGIPSEERALIFERFHRLPASENDSTRGAGIGLALVREATHALKGRLELESEYGEGSCFRVRLPAIRMGDVEAASGTLVDRDRLILETESLARPGHSEWAQPPRQSEDPQGTVLVVEDNTDLRRHLIDVLADNWHTFAAGNGQEGLKAAQVHAPDLIVSDIMMPDMDGLQMLEALRADLRTSHIPVLLLTARQDTETRLKGLALSADDFLAKPFDAAELQLRLNRMIENRRRLRERLLRDISHSQDVDELEADGEDVTGAEIPALSGRDEELLAQLDEWLLERHADASAGMDDLCRTLNIELRTLQRKLRALLGRSPAECLRNYRLEKAADQLLATDLTITEIALSCGFSSPQYFTRQFRNRYGKTPSGWRDDQPG